MKKLKMLSTTAFRLMALMLCLAMAVPQLEADVIVAGNSSSLFGGNWTTSSNSSNRMTQRSGTNYYYLTKTNVNLPGNLEFKVVDNGNWYGSGNNGSGGNVSCSASGTHTITFLYNSNSHEVDRIGTFSTDVIVTGSDTQALGSSWANSDLSNAMTTSDGLTFTLTRTVQYSSGSSKEFKVHSVTTDRWYGTSSGGNVYYSIPAAGEYEVTYTFNVITREVSASVVSTQPVIPDYYITGDNGLGLGGWSYNQLTTMTYDEDNDVYTYSYNVPTAGTYYFAFADGPGTSWDNFNANHRYGPTSGNETVTLGSWATTQKGSGSYAITVDAGPVTITFDVANSRFKVEGTAPVIPNDYYVVGDIFPNGWNTGASTLMTDNEDGTYSWTSGEIYLNIGTNYAYKVYGSDGSAHPNGDNATFNVNVPGTYTVTITYDSNTGNVTAVTTPVTLDPSYTYDIYVRYEGNENIDNVFVYAWDDAGTLSDPWNGSTGGTALSTLTSQEINGYTYYHVTYTSYDQTIHVIFDENGSSSTQTANLTANPGNNYFTYGGGSIVTGPTTTPDEEIVVTYYVKGDDLSIFPNGWNEGENTVMTDNEDGTYSWTSGEFQLNAGTNYAYKVWGDNGSWHPTGDNATFSANIPGTYTVTITYDSNNETVTHELTLIAASPIYITGDAPMGISDWSPVPTTTLTYDATTGYYTYECVVANTGSYRFVFATGQGADADDWDTFNNNYRMGPQYGDQNITVNSDWITTQKSNGDNGAYKVMLPAGTYTIIYDPATGKFKITGVAPIFITGDLGLGLGWSYAPTTAMIYDESTGLYSYTYRVPKQGTYGFVFATAQVLGIDNEGDAWNTFNSNYRIGPTGDSDEVYTLGTDEWKPTQMANLGESDDAHAYSVKLPAGYVTIYFDNTADNMQFKVESEGILGEDLYMVGGITCDSTIHYYNSNDGVLMKYDNSKKLYYLNHITLNTNSTFCFTTALGEDWQHVGTRYGNCDTDTNYFEAAGGDATAHLRVTGDKINVNMPLDEWDDTTGEWQMNTAGIYNVVVNIEDGWVKLIRTDQFTLFPMNVYLQQTDNVEINNIGTPGTTYSKDDFTGYWPLVAYNRLTGDWDPNDDACHYAVTYMGDTTTTDGKTWWHWQVSASIAEVIFTRTNQSPYQSEVIARKAGVLWYTWEEDNTMTAHSREYFTSSATALPGNVVVEEGHYYVYFINTVGWETVNCVAWGGNSSPYYDGHGKDVQTWPGQTMTCIGIDPMTGYEVWEYDFGAIDDSSAPDDVLFHDGTPFATTDAKEQTGDFDFINGGVYDYLGLFDDAYTLNSLIRTAKKNVRYTISNDLLGVYYDADAETDITYELSNGSYTTERVIGALYAKDLNDYGEKSEKPMGDEFIDYVYDVCGGTGDDPRPSQIMNKEEKYDQSNWIKLVVSPNYDGGTPLPASHPDLSEYVDHIIPGKTLQLYMTDSINPTGRVMAISMGDPMDYNLNVYVSAHFNDTVVFNYTHRDWQPEAYNGNYRTVPYITWKQNGQSGNIYGEVTRKRLDEDPVKMFYVAPKPQEIAYITWVVYDNDNEPMLPNDVPPYGNYVSGVYQPYTIEGLSLPKDPGRFYAPSNWDRSITINYSYLEQLVAQGKITQEELESLSTDGYLSENQLNNIAGGFGQQYGPYSNGYMQYGGIKVNWSLFDESKSGGKPWWQIFRPGQAYKFKAIIRYARGSEGDDSADNFYYGPSNGGNETGDGTVLSAPRRAGAEESYNPNMYFTGNYTDEGLDKSKFIIFPIEASAAGSNGGDMGNVTAVKEIVQDMATSRTVTSVRYYNLTGVESSQPFDGINIVVTTYSDGSRSSKKILR